MAISRNIVLFSDSDACVLVDRFSVYIEAVASDMFGAGASGMINPPDPSRYYSISVAELAVFDRDVYDLLMDLSIIYDMAKVSRH